MTKSLMTKEEGWGTFLSRLVLPAVIIIAIIIVEIFFTFSGGVRSYLDAGFVFFVAFFVIRLFDTALIVWHERQRKPYPLPEMLRGLILSVMYLILLFVILKNMLRVNITPYLATSAILTMILGLAFQGVLSNILSGMSLQFTKSFSRGDWVGIGPNEGIVVTTNWRETRLLDRHSNIIVLPNNLVASERITNFSRPDKKTAIVLTFKIGYDAPVTNVFQALLEAANDCPDVLGVPSPEAQITSYDEFGISYLLKFWITDFGRKNWILGDVGRLAWYKLRRRNIKIALALGEKIEDVWRAAREAPAGKRKIEASAGEKEKNYLDLLHSSFLRPQPGDQTGQMIVSPEDLQALAVLVRRSSYTKDEILFRQGEKGTSCFVVARGKIRGEIAYEEGGKKHISEFIVEPRGIFGEMSLFTGMPRTATGIVAEESELLEIQAEDFAVLLDRNPALAEVIAEIVSRRNEENKEFLRKIKELSEKDIQDSTNKKTILEYLKRFVRGLKLA